MPQPAESGSGGSAGAAGLPSCCAASGAGIASGSQTATATANHRGAEAQRVPWIIGAPRPRPQQMLLWALGAELSEPEESSAPLRLCGSQLQLQLQSQLQSQLWVMPPEASAAT